MHLSGARTIRRFALSCFCLLAFLTPLFGSGSASAQAPFQPRCVSGVHADEGSGWIWLPQGQLFCSLVADPKAERSFMTYLRGDFATIANPPPGEKTNIGAVGLGDSFGIFRYTGSTPGDGLQLDLSAAVLSQFNLDQPSFDLINADYLVGLPLTFRNGGFTTRLRVYHQSSHLGDEFLLNTRPERLNISFESLELILSHEVSVLRLYAGGEHFFAREPDDLPERLLHGGAELRPVSFGSARLFAAVDVKAVEEVDWRPAWSARGGLEIARVPTAGHPPQIIGFMIEFYDGLAPYGQFYRDDIRYVGFGFQLFL